MIRRQNTGFADGLWSLPAGHVEKGESVKTAMIREAKEEINIDVLDKNLKLKHILHRKSNINTYIDFFFLCTKWQGEPINNEPQKCSDIKWFDIEQLPTDIIQYIKEIILKKENGEILSILGLK